MSHDPDTATTVRDANTDATPGDSYAPDSPPSVEPREALPEARSLPPLDRPVIVEADAISDTNDRAPGSGRIDAAAKPDGATVPAGTPRIIALMNQKGGVGKTTTCVSVGAALAASGQNVLLIDLDPQAHLTLSLGVDPSTLEKTNYELIADDDTTAMEVVRQVEGYDSLAVLPAETNLAGVESELADLVRTGLAQSILRNKGKDLFAQFDTVLIDCPPSLGLLTINALTAASEIVVPMQAHFLALQGMTKLFETVHMVRQGINPNLVVSGVVLCMHEANTLLASEVIKELEAFFAEADGTDAPWAGAVVYQPPIRRNIKLAEAPSFGRPVHLYAPESNGAADYQHLAKHIAARRPVTVNTG